MRLDVDELVELDRLNMAPVIERAGGKFDPQLRRRKLLIEQECGAKFLCVGRQGKTVAYLEYIHEPDGAWTILSIQIHPAHQTGFVLRDLLIAARERLRVHAPTAIRSSVHVTNRASLTLHRKLGFEETERSADRIVFRANPSRIGERLSHFEARKTAANKSVELSSRDMATPTIETASGAGHNFGATASGAEVC